MRLMHLGNGRWTMKNVATKTISSRINLQSGEAVPSDTIAIVADGHIGTMVEIPVGADTMEIKLQQVTEGPWLGSMVRIPGGTFIMGYLSGDMAKLGFDEIPDTTAIVHSVSISAFFMDTTEVTQEEYIRVMGINPSYHTGNSLLPVENVTWYDAIRYCIQRTMLEGRESCYDTVNWTCDLAKDGYRLPTEAEWEYACRAGSSTLFFWGDDTAASIIDKYSWYAANSNLTTHVVAEKIKNRFGLYDMIGNAEEWCTDRFGRYTYKYQKDPVTFSIEMVEGVARGGEFYAGNSFPGRDAIDYRTLCSANRTGIFISSSAKSPALGFRVVSRNDAKPLKMFKITPTSASGGAIYPAFPVSIEQDSIQKFRICTYPGAQLDSVTLGSQKLEILYAEDTSVSVTNVHKNDTIKAWFRQPQVTVGQYEGSMVFITGGTFLMGDQTGRGNAEERPLKSMTVSSFYMDTTEVTQNEFRSLGPILDYEVIDSTEIHKKKYNYHLSEWVASGYSIPYDTIGELPVECSWNDAAYYCNKRSIKNGLDTVYLWDGDSIIAIDSSKNGFRLPFEAEWEYACKAGTTTDFFWGNETDSATIDKYLVCIVNVIQYDIVFGLLEIGGYCELLETGKKLPNNYGLYDMCGNIMEWCNDIPSQRRDWMLTGEEYVYRVVKGGGRMSDLNACRSSSQDVWRYDRDFHCGFRTVRKP